MKALIMKVRSMKTPTIKKRTSFAIVSTLVVAGLSASIPAHSASLSDLFGGQAKTSQKGKFLSVDEAFQVAPSVQGNKVSLTFDITKGHYVYRDKLKLTLPAGVTASQFTFDKKPHSVKDPTFGTVWVFDDSTVTATTTLSSTQSTKNTPISIKWQGCAKAGLCYPPEKVQLTVNVNSQNLKKKKH